MLLELLPDGPVERPPEEYVRQGERVWIALLDHRELEASAQYLGLSSMVVTECLKGGSSSFESHDRLDYSSLIIPDDRNPQRSPQRLCILLREDLLVFTCKERPLLDELGERIIANEDAKHRSLSRILYAFYDKLTCDDDRPLQKIERQIDQLEEALLTAQKQDCTKEIIALRKKLKGYGRYYAQLSLVLEMLLENENQLLDPRTLRYFKMLRSRVARLSEYHQSLREGVTQVREAYQAQVDIHLNQLMKLYTVITTIFLPLTLIVGWYGMNLQMPEYHWSFGYPLVICTSVGVVAFCLWYFKKHEML